MYVILCTNGGTRNFFLSYKRGFIYSILFLSKKQGDAILLNKLLSKFKVTYFLLLGSAEIW